MEKKEKFIIALCAVVTIAAGILHYIGVNEIIAFSVSALALASLAVVVGDATE